jgi:hypothetical protein
MLNTPQLEALENEQKRGEKREPKVERKCCMKGYPRFEARFRVKTVQYMSVTVYTFMTLV